jgi:RimJ/RimL family protein N-acetyltransferase
MFSVKPLDQSDLVDMYQAIQHSRDSLHELGWLVNCEPEQFVKHYMAILKMKILDIFAIRVDGQFAGAVELQDQGAHAELGYWLSTQYRGHGWATQAVEQVIATCPKTVKADTLKSNPASSHVLERLGFVREWSDSGKNYYQLIKSTCVEYC